MSKFLGDNFSYKGLLPNFARDLFETYEEMIKFNKLWLDEGHISYCVDKKKHYKWNGESWEELISYTVNGGDLVIADNLTTDDPSQALSARQGFLLGQKMDILYKVKLTGGGIHYREIGKLAKGSFSWTVAVNGTSVMPTSQEIKKGNEDPEPLSLDVRSYDYSNDNITENTNYYLTADGLTITFSIKFYPPTYLGVVGPDFSNNPSGDQITNEQIGVDAYPTIGPFSLDKIYTQTDGVNVNGTNKICLAVSSNLKVQILNGDNSLAYSDGESSFTKYTTTINGYEYNVYVLTSPACLTNVEYKYRITT